MALGRRRTATPGAREPRWPACERTCEPGRSGSLGPALSFSDVHHESPKDEHACLHRATRMLSLVNERIRATK